MPKRNKIVILVNDATWIAPLRDRIDAEFGAVEVIEFPSEKSHVLAACENAMVVVNLLSALSDQGSQAHVELSLEILAELEQRPVRVVNDATCHRHAVSKWRQDRAFRNAGLPTPQTTVWQTGQGIPELDPATPWLVKPNLGGRGQRISTDLADLEAAAAFDGFAIIQHRIDPRDGRIHRVELLNGELLYHATAGLEEARFDYCLGGGLERQVNRRLPPGLETPLRHLAAHTHLELGSVEFLIDHQGVPRFIDLNPTSTLAPSACASIGFDPVDCQAIWICHQLIPEVMHGEAIPAQS